jgi:hypothetical protein
VPARENASGEEREKTAFFEAKKGIFDVKKAIFG